MAAESLESVDVGWNGLAGDRRWAFLRMGSERKSFPWLTIRDVPGMWKYVPRFVEPDRPEHSATLVRTPRGVDLDVADPGLAAELENGARVIKQGRGAFDTMPLSLISTRTIDALGATFGTTLDSLRFRPNLVVRADGDADYPEDRWVGRVLRIGGMRMRVDKRDQRCVMVNVDPQTTARDPDVLRTIARERDACLGVYGTVVEPGPITTGDTITVE